MMLENAGEGLYSGQKMAKINFCSLGDSYIIFTHIVTQLGEPKSEVYRTDLS